MHFNYGLLSLLSFIHSFGRWPFIFHTSIYYSIVIVYIIIIIIVIINVQMIRVMALPSTTHMILVHPTACLLYEEVRHAIFIHMEATFFFSVRSSQFYWDKTFTCATFPYGNYCQSLEIDWFGRFGRTTQLTEVVSYMVWCGDHIFYIYIIYILHITYKYIIEYDKYNTCI